MPFFNVGENVIKKPIARVLLWLTILLAASFASASDYGSTGLIDIPTARMAPDGTLTTTAAIQSRTNSYAITYQATPWLEATFRYTGFNQFFYYDRNYEVKVRLLKEQDYLPQVAMGVRDMVGTGVFGSEYIVASKTLGSFDATFGVGWGRLAGSGQFSNPLRGLSSAFDDRDNDYGEGGEFSTNTFFSGSRAGLFGGLQYRSETLPLKWMLEYNPDQYDWESRRGGLRPKSPWSVGVQWQPWKGMTLGLSRQHNQEWGIELSATLDSKKTPARRVSSFFVSSLDMPAEDLPSMLDEGMWYDTLLFDVERSGLLLIEATVNPSNDIATLVVANLEYPLWADAVAKMSVLADLHLPATIRTFRFVLEEAGHRVHTVQMSRPSSAVGRDNKLFQRQIKVLPGRRLTRVLHKTNFVQSKVIFDVNLAARFQLFDPDDPMRYQLFGNVGVNLALPRQWSIRGAYAFDLANNFDGIARQSNSILPHVRSDVARYLQEGQSGLDSLYAERRGSVRRQLHYRVFGGVLEEMYSGIGGELLFQPFQSRLAYGFSANWVRQRDYDRSLKHLDYKTATAFASVYWASPFYNMDLGIHAGKYLAKDLGATFEVRRTFSNGWMVGLWATLTDVPFDDFGEGSFDKGMFFRVPLDGLLGRRTRSSYGNSVRPIQRDGGQRLENFSGNLWWDMRGARYDALIDHTTRMLP